MPTEDVEAIIKIIERFNVWDDTGTITPRKIIAETLMRIPESVKEKVLEDATFIIMDGAYGCVLMGLVSEEKDKEQLISFSKGLVWVRIDVQLILLNFALMEKDELDEEEMRITVAHEIAHFILGHHRGYTGPKEEEADDLIVEWGFKRAYQSYEQFARS